MKITIERAIDILDPAHKERYCDLPDGMEQIAEACWMGMKALEKQVPKKVVVRMKAVSMHTYYNWYYCPNCTACLYTDLDRESVKKIETKNFLYCYRCGQALDWREYESNL